MPTETRDDGQSGPEDDARLCTIFLSHSSRDNEVVAALALQLESLHSRVWIDTAELHVADELPLTIAQGINECDFVIVALSPDSLESQWVQREIDLSLGREAAEGLPDLLIPVLLRDCEVPCRIKDRVWADFRKATADPAVLVECTGYDDLLEKLYRPMSGAARIQRCVNTLVRRLEDPAFDSRREACALLGALGQPAILPLAQRLNGDDEPLLRNCAAWALARLAGEGHQEARDALQHAVETEQDPLVLDTLREAIVNLDRYHPA